MLTAYDPKALLKQLADQGLPLAEDAAEKVVLALFGWLDESATLSGNKIDDALKILYPHAKELALKQIDKLDGKAG